jgi:hypothetical protein
VNNAEARAIQKEFGKDMQAFAENTPVVGHIASGVHLAVGNHEKAGEVFVVRYSPGLGQSCIECSDRFWIDISGATKSTVVAAAGMAGVVCGPAAAACAVSFALSSNAAWDVSDSAIAGRPKGMVKQIDDVSQGKANIGDVFDLAAGKANLG